MSRSPLTPVKSALRRLSGAGKKRSQPLFEALFRFATQGMNFGYYVIEKNGELGALDYARGKLEAAGRPRPYVVFDVGANFGQYAAAARRRLGEAGVIYSFEPSTTAFSWMKEKVPADAFADGSIRPFNFGLGDKEEELELFYSYQADQTATVHPPSADDAYQRFQHETVKIRRLDDFCREQGIGHIHFLKIDVEGHEFKVLEGAKALLEAGAVDFIQFEFGENHVDSRTFFHDFYQLLSGRYRLYRIVRDGLVPITDYSRNCEIFVGSINYLAEHRALVGGG